MAQFYNLTLDTLAPQSCSITGINTYYKAADTKSANLNATGASYQKVWVNQTAVGTTSDTEIPANWEAYSTTKTFALSKEGTNYVHALFMDAVGNISPVINSTACIYDATAPGTPTVSINGGATHTTSVDVTVRVTVADVVPAGADAVSGIAKVTLSGDLDASSTTEFTWDDTDRSNGYKDCSVKLEALSSGEDEDDRTVSATATDRAGNTGTAGSDTIKLDTVLPTATLTLKYSEHTTTGKTGTLPEFVGELSFLALIEDTSTLAQDVVAYKIWGDFDDSAVGEPSTWTNMTSSEIAAHQVEKELSFTDSDGQKYVYVRVKDDAGNIYPAVGSDPISESRYVDRVVPTVTLARDVARISAQTGHDTITFTINVTDACALPEAGTTVQIYATNGSTTEMVKSATYENTSTTTLVDATMTITYAELNAKSVAADGTVSFVAKAKDMANREGSSAETIQVIIDTVGPAGALTVSGLPYSNQGTHIDPSGASLSYINIDAASTTFACSATDDSGFGTYKAWIDNTALSTNIPASAVAHDYTLGTAIPATNVDRTGLVDGTTNYLHAQMIDSLGNQNIIHSTTAFTYDTTPTTNNSVAFTAEGEGALTQRTQVLTLGATDATTQPAKMKIWGQIVSSLSVIDPTATTTKENAVWLDYATGATVYLQANNDAASNKNKTIYACFLDAAGNECTQVTCNRDLEDTDPTVAITVQKVVRGTATTITSGAKVQVRNFQLNPITVTEATFTGPYSYAILGALDQVDGTISEDPDEWTWHAFSSESGSTQTVTELTWTDSDGEKEITVYVKDANGNMGNAPFEVELDRTAAVVTVSDYELGQVISLQTGKRKNADGSDQSDVSRTIDGVSTVINYMDMSFFKFSASETIKEWKVCVNSSKFDVIDPHTVIENASPIPTTNGSKNMSGSATVESGTEINCLIRGADFSADPEVNGVNGAYEVIVFAKNETGEWSAIHKLAVPEKIVTATATATDGTNPVEVGTVISTKVDVSDVSSPDLSSAIGVEFGTNNDVSKATSYTITADVSDLGSDVTKVDVYQYTA